MTMLGKRKLLMVVSGIVGSLAARYLTPEGASQVTELVATLTPIVLAMGAVGANTGLAIKRDNSEKAKEMQKTEQLKWQGTDDPQDMYPDTIVEPFDADGFMSRVDRLATSLYKDAKPDVGTFYAYRDIGMKVRCKHIAHALSYWDMYVELAHEAFTARAGFSPGDAENHLDKGGGCPYVSVESMARQEGYYPLLLDVRHAIDKQRDMEKLAATDIDWKYKLGGSASLYIVGVTAEEMLRLGQ